MPACNSFFNTIIALVLLLSGIDALRHSRSMIVSGEQWFYPVDRFRLWLIVFILGSDRREKSKQYIENNRNWRLHGINSLVYGIGAIIGCFIILLATYTDILG